MEMICMVMFAAVAALAAVSMFMALWCKYDDGLFGKLALLCVCAGATMIVVEWAFKIKTYEWPPEVVLMVAGLACFYLRHIARRLHRLRARFPLRRAGDRA
jgi:predicted anti-sigma-YlaC factor YlaD